jgi:hypothetical protein
MKLAGRTTLVMGRVGFQFRNAIWAACLLATAPAAARAASFTGTQAPPSVALGTFVVDNTATTFRLSASGTGITKPSGGTGVVLTTTATPPGGTIKCATSAGNCKNTYTVTIDTADASITGFNIASISGTAGGPTIVGPATQNVKPISFTVTGMGSSGDFTVTFKLGLDVSVSTATPGRGNKTFNYTMNVSH